MHIERIVTICLEAIEQGATVESCLARYPDRAAELAPLLQLALSLRAHPKLRMSDQAFHTGRATLRAAALAAKGKHRSAAASLSHNGARWNGIHANHRSHNGVPEAMSDSHHRVGIPRDQAQNEDRVTPQLIDGSGRSDQLPRRTRGKRTLPHPMTQRQRRRIQPLLLAVVALFFITSAASLLYQTAESLPGTALYEVKTASRQAQGALMRAAGEGAAWYAYQTTQHLRELQQQQFHGAATDDATTSYTVRQIEHHVQQALVAAATLSTEQQQQFYTTWLHELTILEHSWIDNNEIAPLVHTVLDQVLAQVTAAANQDEAIEVLPDNGSQEQSAPSAQNELQLQQTVMPNFLTESVVTATPDMNTAEATGMATVVITADTTEADIRRVPDLENRLGITGTPASIQTAIPTRILLATPLSPTATSVQSSSGSSLRIPPTLHPSTPSPFATATPIPVITRVMPKQVEETGEGGNDEQPSDETGADQTQERENAEGEGNVEERMTEEQATEEQTTEEHATEENTPGETIPENKAAETRSHEATSEEGLPSDKYERDDASAAATPIGTATVEATTTEFATPPAIATDELPAPTQETVVPSIATPIKTAVPSQGTLQAAPDPQEEATLQAPAPTAPDNTADELGSTPESTSSPAESTAMPPATLQSAPTEIAEEAATSSEGSVPIPRPRRPHPTATPVPQHNEMLNP